MRVLASLVAIAATAALATPSHATTRSEPIQPGARATSAVIIDPVGDPEDVYDNTPEESVDLTRARYSSTKRGNLRIVWKAVNVRHGAELDEVRERYVARIIHRNGREFVVSHRPDGSMTVLSYDAKGYAHTKVYKNQLHRKPGKNKVVMWVPSATIGNPVSLSVAPSGFLIERGTGNVLSLDFGPEGKRIFLEATATTRP